MAKNTLTVELVANPQGKEDVRISAGGRDGSDLAREIEAAFNAALAEQMRRPEFSGQFEIVVLGTTPITERRLIPPMIDRLRAICNELSTGDQPYRVSLTYQAQVSKKGLEAASALSTAASQMPRAATQVERASSSRMPVIVGGVLVVAAVAGGAAWMFLGGPVPRSVELGSLRLSKVSAWSLAGVDGGSYVASGQSLATAPLRVDVAVSTTPMNGGVVAGAVRTQNTRGARTFYDEIGRAHV